MDDILREIIDVDGTNITAEAIDEFEQCFKAGLGIDPERDRRAARALLIQLGAWLISSDVDQPNIFGGARAIFQSNKALRKTAPQPPLSASPTSPPKGATRIRMSPEGFDL